MSRVTLDRPWLDFDLGEEMQVLSWAVNRPGLVRARRILWREVRNADLPQGLDVDGWLAGELSARDATDAVTLLTSRDIRAELTQGAARGRWRSMWSSICHLRTTNLNFPLLLSRTVDRLLSTRYFT